MGAEPPRTVRGPVSMRTKKMADHEDRPRKRRRRAAKHTACVEKEHTMEDAIYNVKLGLALAVLCAGLIAPFILALAEVTA